MISKNRIKFIHSLEKKKFRREYHAFVAEGPKLLSELINTLTPTYLAATHEWLGEHRNESFLSAIVEMDEVSQEELERASLLRTPQQVLAIFPLPEENTPIEQVANDELVLALDGVQDPGNMGTIVRLADWFGIHHIYCSLETADVLSPKAIQATMGAIARVHVHYSDLLDALTKVRNQQIPIYGTHLDGENIYNKPLTHHGVIVMGNEGNGISPEVSRLVNERLYIPPYPIDAEQVESLNVAIATAIVCAEFRRRI